VSLLPPNNRPSARPQSATMDFTDDPAMDMLPDESSQPTYENGLLRRVIIMAAFFWGIVLIVVVTLVLVF
jgi:hypothetical protein